MVTNYSLLTDSVKLLVGQLARCSPRCRLVKYGLRQAWHCFRFLKQNKKHSYYFPTPLSTEYISICLHSLLYSRAFSLRRHRNFAFSRPLAFVLWLIASINAKTIAWMQNLGFNLFYLSFFFFFVATLRAAFLNVLFCQLLERWQLVEIFEARAMVFI